MKLRTKFLLVMTLILGGILFFYESVSDQTLSPSFERQGLERVSLLGGRSRDRLDQFLSFVEVQSQGLARFYNLESQTLEAPGPALLKLFGFSSFNVIENESLKNSKGSITNTHSQWSFFQDAQKAWKFELLSGARRLVTTFEASDIQKFLPRSEGNVESFFVPLNEEASSPDMKRWQNWAKEAGNFDQVETLRWKDRSYFAALSPSAKYDFAVLTLWPADIVKAPWQQIKIQLRWLTLMLLALTLLVVLFLVKALIRPLDDLREATEQVSKGDFQIQFLKKPSDEFGKLMTAFVSMSSQIQDLIAKTRGSARMELELQTAKMVQENFFPKPENKMGSVQIVGRSWPASECGGDLWACWETENFAYVFIGDATGHGVSAALMTSAVRAIIAVIENSRLDSLPQMIEMLRRAIETNGRGTTCVSAVLVQIEKSTGFVRYFNAGHEESIVLPAKIEDRVTWKDLKILFEPTNPHLGMKANYAPLFATHRLIAGEKIFLSTDGLMDIVNEKNEPWKSRQILKSLLESFKEGQRNPKGSSLMSSLDSFSARIQQRRQGRDLVDDVSVVVIEWAPKG